MNRAEAIARLAAGGTWDVVVIGGGATGLATAFDAVTRGYKVALIERDDFAQGTSSRSTKLVHGGVRYLRQGRLGLVRSALRERDRLLDNAPGLVHPRDFIVPAFSTVEKIYYGAGLKAYDWLARGSEAPGSRILSRAETAAALPGIRTTGLVGGVRYTDGQFDDAALAIALVGTASRSGATLVNYVRAVGLRKRSGRVCGVEATDVETGAPLELEARIVINATGAFTDEVRKLDEPGGGAIIAPSQGAHVVLPAAFLRGDAALMVPKTDDGRVLFAVPWLGRVLVGTTDTPLSEALRQPMPFPEEIDFLLAHAARYLERAPQRTDVTSVFAGIRPLVKSGGSSTSALSRDHVILVSASGLVTIAGGKWTTCRQMAEDVVTRAAIIGGLPAKSCVTATLKITRLGPPSRATALHPRLDCTEADVFHAAEAEMARTVEDVLARRTRSLYLDARAAAEVAPRVAAILGAALGRDSAWRAAQARAFQQLAELHLPAAPAGLART